MSNAIGCPASSTGWSELMGGYRATHFPFELVVGLVIAMLAGGVLVGMADAEMKYKLAMIAAVGGFAVLAAFPERRVACVVLWVLIHPLSIEKVFFIDAAEGPQFSNPTIALNMSDAPLVLLALFLLAETLSTNRLAFLAWSAVSFAIHATFLGDGFTTSAPLALLQDVRLLIFVFLIQSAIRS